MSQHSCSNTQIKEKFNHSKHVVSCQRVMKGKALFVCVEVVVLGHAVYNELFQNWITEYDLATSVQHMPFCEFKYPCSLSSGCCN